MSNAEKTPLLSSSSSGHGEVKGQGETVHYGSSHSLTQSQGKGDGVKMKRHITLPYAVAIMVGNVIGSGIFVSPKGVTANIGSVGASLIVWALTGFYNLAQALCYAELGTVIPLAGGDYAYLYEILGPFPAFLTAWIHVVVIASSSCAVIARTAGLYLIQPFGLQCRLDIITLIAVFIIISLATINAYSSVAGTRAQVVFTVAKVTALIIIIIGGFVAMGQGHTQNFENGFEGTTKDPGSIALSVLDGYFAYKGWELINALPEEMVNPERDLPLTVWISMTLVTGIYVLTNVAYFTVLSPAELTSSDAVALTYAEQALGPITYVIPLFVALSCMGAVNGDFLSNSRYIFAGGRYRQVPRVFSYIHITQFTPLLAVALLCMIALVYTVITDLQVMQEYASLTVQLKMLMVLTALFYLRWKAPNLHRPCKVNIVIAVVTFIVMIAIVALSFYKSPVTTGIGVGVFLCGVPLYGLILLCRDRPSTNSCMDKVTVWLQILLKIAPETDAPNVTNRILNKDKHVS